MMCIIQYVFVALSLVVISASSPTMRKQSFRCKENACKLLAILNIAQYVAKVHYCITPIFGVIYFSMVGIIRITRLLLLKKNIWN